MPSRPETGGMDPLGVRLSKHGRLLAWRAKRATIDVAHPVARLAKVTAQKVVGRADYARWSNPENLERWWDTRTQKLASFIPAHSRVIEFGAGRCRLREYLPEGCIYFPSDLTSRGPDTIVCDLNQRPLPDLTGLKADVAVFGGVLEYMRDLAGLVNWLAGQAPLVVASYDHLKSNRASPRRIAELVRRNYFGYMNSYTVAELTDTFVRAGFVCVNTDEWQSQKIFVFEQRSRR